MTFSSRDSLSFEISIVFLATKTWDIPLMDPLSYSVLVLSPTGEESICSLVLLAI